MPRRVPDLLERLSTRFLVDDGCWPWIGGKPHGYGVLRVPGGEVRRAHVVLYELLVGPVPDGLELDHLCRNRGCVSPTHMEPVTPAENGRRGAVARWAV